MYDVRQFTVRFLSPTGNEKIVSGFWDGGAAWKVRFCPDETGTWSYQTHCSDTLNTGLHLLSGTFDCVRGQSDLAIYKNGSVVHQDGTYHLSHSDGTPFFYSACTAWNGTLKSTDQEWETYLADRAHNHYNVIQFTATQWRGADVNSEGQKAFEGSGRISINPAYFKHLDKKIDAINMHGLVAAPVLLWALPVSAGRELSPGYYLPDAEAILLARYLVARYGAHHVIWILGGDGLYLHENEQRWKTIGRGVFGDWHPGTVALHPMGKSWIGSAFAGEDWLDIVGYQSGHSADPNTLDWIVRGPVASEWAKLPPKVMINMEPCYEQISPSVTADAVRGASYRSLFSTPVGGISYGANGIWPWIRPGEKILNHGQPAFLNSWSESIRLPGSVQVGLLSQFIRQFEWWSLKPAQELLVNQQDDVNQFVSVVSSADRKTILAYSPAQNSLKIRNPFDSDYHGSWFDPASGKMTAADIHSRSGILETKPPKKGDQVLVLRAR